MRTRGQALLMVAVITSLSGCSQAAGSQPFAVGPLAVPGEASAQGAGLAAGSDPGEVSSDIRVQGRFGQEPRIVFSGDAPADTVERTVLSEGKGEEVSPGDLVVADYLGQIHGGDVFDQSFERGTPIAFVSGDGSVIPGWDKGLAGVPTGSRVLLSLPPEDAYGPTGTQDGVITGSDTLVFVIDVLEAYSPDTTLQEDVTEADSVPGLEVSADVTTRPAVELGPEVEFPEEPEVVVLQEGQGPEVSEGQIAMHYTAFDATGQSVESTWDLGALAPAVIGDGSTGSTLDLLVGVPVGSRVAVLLPEVQGAPSPSGTVVIVDVIDQFSDVPVAALS